MKSGSLRSFLATLERFFFTPSSGVQLGICRFVFFGWLFVIYRFYYGGTETDVFWTWYKMPSELWQPVSFMKVFSSPPLSPAWAHGLETTFYVSCVLASIGLLGRWSIAVAALSFVFLVDSIASFGDFYHRDMLPATVALVFICARCTDHFSVDAWLFKRGRSIPQESADYTWPIRLIWVLQTLMYTTAGITKLRVSGLEWITSNTLQNYMLEAHFGQSLDRAGQVLQIGLRLSDYPELCHALAAAAILFEILAVCALFLRTRPMIWIVLAMHVFIHLTITPDFEAHLAIFACWIPWGSLSSKWRSRGSQALRYT